MSEIEHTNYPHSSVEVTELCPCLKEGKDWRQKPNTTPEHSVRVCDRRPRGRETEPGAKVYTGRDKGRTFTECGEAQKRHKLQQNKRKETSTWKHSHRAAGERNPWEKTEKQPVMARPTVRGKSWGRNKTETSGEFRTQGECSPGPSSNQSVRAEENGVAAWSPRRDVLEGAPRPEGEGAQGDSGLYDGVKSPENGKYKAF